MTTHAPVPATRELLDELRVICAETVEIPIDKITVEADLAADLGIDSRALRHVRQGQQHPIDELSHDRSPGRPHPAAERKEQPPR
jgi:hypothetical protein